MKVIINKETGDLGVAVGLLRVMHVEGDLVFQKGSNAVLLVNTEDILWGAQAGPDQPFTVCNYKLLDNMEILGDL